MRDWNACLRTIWPRGFVRYGGRLFHDHRLAKYAKRNGGRDTCKIIEDNGTSLRVIPWGARCPIEVTAARQARQALTGGGDGCR